MQNKLFLKAADICELLEVKQTSAYEIIGNLNKELEEQGYLTLRGKVPTKYFVKRFYGVEDTCEIPQEKGKDSGPRVKLRNGKEISYNSRARGWILNLEISWRFITKIWMSVSEKTLCTRSDILLT